MKIKIVDYIIFIVVILLIVFSFKITKKITTKCVEITTPYKRLIFSLKKDKLITVKGQIGDLTVEIRSGKVRVIRASCPNKICIKTGWITEGNSYIACVPNGILIKLISGKHDKKSFDFITE